MLLLVCLVFHLQVCANAMSVYSVVGRDGVVLLEARVSAVVPERVCGAYADLYTMWAVNPGFRESVVGEVERQLEEVLAEQYASVGVVPRVASLSINYTVERLPSSDCSVLVKLYAVVEGVGQGGNTIVVKYRYVRLDEPINVGGFRIVPSKTFFIDFSTFGKPLGDWERIYNGTHTIFRLHVNEVEVEVGEGVRVLLDPEMVIVVQGYAIGAGDTIFFEEQPKTTVTRTVTVTRYATKTVTETVTEITTTTATVTREEVVGRVAEMEPGKKILAGMLAVGVAIAMLVGYRRKAGKKKYVRARNEL